MLMRSSSSHVIKLVELVASSKLTPIREGSESDSSSDASELVQQVSHEVNAQIELMYRHLQHILRVQQDRGTFNLKPEAALEARTVMTKLSPRISNSRAAIKKSTEKISRSESFSREPQNAIKRGSRSSNRSNQSSSSPRNQSSEDFGQFDH